jgi:hypothetical protein
MSCCTGSGAVIHWLPRWALVGLTVLQLAACSEDMVPPDDIPKGAVKSRELPWPHVHLPTNVSGIVRLRVVSDSWDWLQLEEVEEMGLRLSWVANMPAGRVTGVGEVRRIDELRQLFRHVLQAFESLEEHVSSPGLPVAVIGIMNGESREIYLIGADSPKLAYLEDLYQWLECASFPVVGARQSSNAPAKTGQE